MTISFFPIANKMTLIKGPILPCQSHKLKLSFNNRTTIKECQGGRVRYLPGGEDVVIRKATSPAPDGPLHKRFRPMGCEHLRVSQPCYFW